MVATPQAGVFSGLNPILFNPANPIVLFIIQVSVVPERYIYKRTFVLN